MWAKRECLEAVANARKRQAGLWSARGQRARQSLSALLGRPVFTRPLDVVLQRQQYLDNLAGRLAAAGKNSFEKLSHRLSLSVSRLDALSPLKILARGYAVSRKLPEKKLVKSVGDVKSGDRLETVLCDGRMLSLIEDVVKEK